MEEPLVFLGKLESLDSPVYNRHIIVPEDISHYFLAKNITRLKVTLNAKITTFTGLLPLHGEYYILMNKANCQKLKININDMVEVSLSEDTSKYGMPMPTEMEEVLECDPISEEHFKNLTPGKQRSLIYIVAKVKNVQSRINKALAISDHLVEYQGKLDFKALNEKIKSYNQKTKL